MRDYLGLQPAISLGFLRGDAYEEEEEEEEEGIPRSDSLSARWMEEVENATVGASRDEALNVFGSEVVKGRIV